MDKSDIRQKMGIILLLFVFCSVYNIKMSITIPPKDYQVLFLDMNSFFASVEQQVRPNLRGLPIGVAPYTGDSGCIIAASREAKAMGIGIGRIGEARAVCPTLKIVEARPALYMLYHKEIRKVVESCTPYFEALSIDEFAIRLTPLDQKRQKAEEFALKLKQKIYEEVGDFLTCSIGIGPSVFLAKMAGERRKPDGLTIITLKELGNFYADLELRDLTGINWRMQSRLTNFGIDSPFLFYKTPLGDLIKKMQHSGRLWYFRLRGHEVDDHVIKSKTVGHSHVLEPKFRSKEGALNVLKQLIQKAGYRLRKEGCYANGVSVSISFTNGDSFHVSKKFPQFCDSASFSLNALFLFKDCRWQGSPLLVSVSAFNLTKKTGNQISIFKDIEKWLDISKSLDEINDRFGADTVFTAATFDSRKSAPDRIPFGKPRYDIRH